jgi:hypothetical protein
MARSVRQAKKGTPRWNIAGMQVPQALYDLVERLSKRTRLSKSEIMRALALRGANLPSLDADSITLDEALQELDRAVPTRRQSRST